MSPRIPHFTRPNACRYRVVWLDLLRERGIALVELLLDLVEDALFVFGERHRPNSLLGGALVGPVRPSSHRRAGADNAVGAARPLR